MYQRSSGGKIWVPLEVKAQLLGGSYTPKFSQMVSWKYSHLSAGAVCEDMELNHGRKMSTKLVQSIGEAGGNFGWTMKPTCRMMCLNEGTLGAI